MKKYLFITFDFPPRRTSGVYRPTAMVKYLARLGWQGTVLTIASDAPGEQDPSLLARIPGETRVQRTPFWQITGWEKHAAKALRSTPVSASPGNGRPAFVGRDGLRRLASWLRSSLYFPDESVGWIPPALERALALQMAERFDVVYTTTPPRAAHVVGLMLRTLCQVPWMAEFRDPWLIPSQHQAIEGIPRPSPGPNRWLIQKIIQHADALVTVTQGQADELAQVWRAPAQKIEVVTNGFDEEDFQKPAGAGSPFEPGYIHLVHFGTIYPRFSGSFFPALREMLRDSPQWQRRLRVHIVGFPSQQALESAQDPALRDVVRIHPFMDHAQALAAMQASHGLLLFWGHEYSSRVSIAGKTYEYLRVGKPLLVIAHEGGLANIVKRAGAGWVVAPDDRPGIQQALRALLEGADLAQPRSAAETEFVARYHYGRLAEQLAQVLRRVAAQ